MGMSLYEIEFRNNNGLEFIKAFQKPKGVFYSRLFGYYATTIPAEFSGIKVLLFLYRKGKNGNCNALLTSNLILNIITVQ